MKALSNRLIVKGYWFFYVAIGVVCYAWEVFRKGFDIASLKFIVAGAFIFNMYVGSELVGKFVYKEKKYKTHNLLVAMISSLGLSILVSIFLLNGKYILIFSGYGVGVYTAPS